MLLSCRFIILGSGADTFLTRILLKLKHHLCPLLYAVDRLFNRFTPNGFCRLTNQMRATWTETGVDSAVVHHAEFGRVTSTDHFLSSRGVPHHAFTLPPCITLSANTSHELCYTWYVISNSRTSEASRASPKSASGSGYTFTYERCVECSLKTPGGGVRFCL